MLIWFHGGNYIAGSSQDTDPSLFAARENVIVVTVNYRLGVFGFASIRQLAAAAPATPDGNYGILDQLASLQWVHSNIQAFGGNPLEVTVGGQSSGAESVWILMTIPEAAGLFQRAFLMSSFSVQGHSLEVEQKVGPSSRVVRALGCGQDHDISRCVLSKSTEEVYDAGGGDFTGGAGWDHVVDGKVLTAPTVDLIGKGQFKSMPILAGNTAKEGGFSLEQRWIGDSLPRTAADFSSYVRTLPHPEQIVASYSVASFPSPDDAIVAI